MSKTNIASCQTNTSLSGHWKMYSLGLACVDLGLGGNKSGSLSPNCSDRNSNKFHWNSSNVRPRGSLWMLLKQFKFKPSRPPSVPLSVSPGWDFGKKRCLSVENHRRPPVGWLLGRQALEREADVPHCWPCTISSSGRCRCSRAQCLEAANPVSRIGAAHQHWKLPANGCWGHPTHWPTCSLPKSTFYCTATDLVKSLPPFPSSHRRQT